MRARWALLETAIEHAGINPDRIRLQWASASEGQKFADGVRELTEKVKKAGPFRRDWT
jgi:F420-non-reducing hydrogenase iron-sulfur subunit